MNCIIVDDEPIAINIIESYLSQIEDYNILAKCTNAIEAYNVLQKEKVDLIFLDIEMPVVTGIDFLKSLKNPPFVILTTAYREFAIDGFDLNVIDYLLKPIRFERFLQAIQKIPKVEGVSKNVEKPMFFKVNGQVQKVLPSEFLYAEGLSNYIKIHLSTGETIVTYNRLSDLEKTYKEYDIIRIHKSYVVSIPKIRKYSNSEVVINNSTLPIGRYYIDKVKKIIDTYYK